MLKKKVLVLVAALCVLLLAGGGLVIAEGGEDFASGEGTSATPDYRYCFLVSGDTELYLDYDGQFIVGDAYAPGCGSGQVLGDLGGGMFFMYRDWPSSSACVEGVWYSGKASNMTYEWINTSGGKGTGTMQPIPCP